MKLLQKFDTTFLRHSAEPIKTHCQVKLHQRLV